MDANEIRARMIEAEREKRAAREAELERIAVRASAAESLARAKAEMIPPSHLTIRCRRCRHEGEIPLRGRLKVRCKYCELPFWDWEDTSAPPVGWKSKVIEPPALIEPPPPPPAWKRRAEHKRRKAARKAARANKAMQRAKRRAAQRGNKSEGDPCPRCGQPTQIREHKAITAKELRRPFYYRRWFYCTNPHCKTTTIMPERFVVWNDNEAGRARRQQREPPPPEPQFDDIVMSVLDGKA
jgi:hypothetical protein